MKTSELLNINAFNNCFQDIPIMFHHNCSTLNEAFISHTGCALQSASCLNYIQYLTNLLQFFIYRVSHFRALEIFSLNWYAFVNFIDLGAKIALVCNIVEFYYCMWKILSSMNKLQYWKKNIVFQCCVLYILHTVCYKSTFICRLNYTCTVH